MRRSPHPTPRLVLAAAVAALVLLVSGCGADDEPKALVPGGSTSTTPPATTTSPPATTEGTEPTTTTTPAPVDLGDAPALHASGPSGSGCSPGSGDLPDGWWYGVSVGFDPGPDSSFTFDLACYFSGDAAYAEGERRGVEVNNDYLVVNDNPALRTVPVAAGATAACVDLGSGVLEVVCDPSDVPDPEVPWAVWFRVVDGEIDRLVEQYAP